MAVLKIIHKDTNEFLGRGILKKEVPKNKLRLLQPFARNHRVIYFQDMFNPATYGFILREKGVIIE